MQQEEKPPAVPPSAPGLGSPLPSRPPVKPRRFDVPIEEEQAWHSIWMSRREFFSVFGWAGLFAFLGGAFATAIRFFFPRITYEPPSIFKAGRPEEYELGLVDERWKRKYRVWVVRETPEEGGGFYAIFARCTHLGCTPNWVGAENKFKCPCHGSGFYRSGVNFEGPAPRPLERVKVELGEDGQLLIDTDVRYRYEKGEWTKPGSTLKV